MNGSRKETVDSKISMSFWHRHWKLTCTSLRTPTALNEPRNMLRGIAELFFLRIIELFENWKTESSGFFWPIFKKFQFGCFPSFSFFSPLRPSPTSSVKISYEVIYYHMCESPALIADVTRAEWNIAIWQQETRTRESLNRNLHAPKLFVLYSIHPLKDA